MLLRLCWLLALLAYLILGIMGSCHSPSPQDTDLPGPLIDVRGLAWIDEGHIWILDAALREVRKIDLVDSSTLEIVKLDIDRPRGLALEGTHLWIADDRAKRVHRVDISGVPRITRSIDVPLHIAKGSAALRSVAFDGTHLWVGYFAGWSSKVIRMDAETGEVVHERFVYCDPIGIASDGDSLWIMRRLSETGQGMVARRPVHNLPVTDDTPPVRITTFVCPRPVAMTRMKGGFMVFDARTRNIVQVSETPPIARHVRRRR
jgi:hypothetical protein